jgi:hypothetical protein
MLFLVFAMLVATGLGVAVVAVVAVPARRHGRDLLTAKGEGVLDSARASARGRTGPLGRRTADTHQPHVVGPRALARVPTTVGPSSAGGPAAGG